MTYCSCHAPPCDYPWCTNPAAGCLASGIRACRSCAGVDLLPGAMSPFVGLAEDGECVHGFLLWDTPAGPTEAARRIFPAGL